MLRGKRVFGLREHKCFDLLERYSNGLSFCAALGSEVYKGVPYFTVENNLDEDRTKFLLELSKALAFVPEANGLDRKQVWPVGT
jgi:hypothetical protein